MMTKSSLKQDIIMKEQNRNVENMLDHKSGSVCTAYLQVIIMEYQFIGFE